MKKDAFALLLLIISVCFILFSCVEKKSSPSQTLIKSMNLKRGEVVTCGPANKEFGANSFAYNGDEKTREELNLGVKLLHSFEYDEAEKVFAGIIEKDPSCALAYWGIAMANFHPMWAPPSEAELKKGLAAIEIANSIQPQSAKEKDYIMAVAAFYQNWQDDDHRTRILRFEKAMQNLYTNYSDDKEAAVFYALSITAAADPTDKTYQKQKQAAEILSSLYPGQSHHPGIVHYLIHAYDYPELAHLGLPAARKYASVAPSSAHALHMPSHIFTRLGLWEESIQSNLASIRNAKCYAEQTGIKGHWEEELHGLDYLVYAYLQKGEFDSAEKRWEYLKGMEQVSPINFKVAYAFTAIPARMLLEERRWKEAAELSLPAIAINWKTFPWQLSTFHFTRLMGAVHTGNEKSAKAEFDNLSLLYQQMLEEKNNFYADKIRIQLATGEAWILLKKGRKEEAGKKMQMAAEWEDLSEKHPVTPGDIIPAWEFLGDLLLEVAKPAEALVAYEASLKKAPNRLNTLYGAYKAAKKMGDVNKMNQYALALKKSTKRSIEELGYEFARSTN